MKIEVKLFASLRRHLPPGSEGGRRSLEVEDRLTVEGLIQKLEIPMELAQLVLVNGENIERNFKRPLQDGEVVSIFPPVAGG